MARDEHWLITGATGQLGGHVTRRLAAEGAQVTPLARRAGTVAGATVVPIDLNDLDGLTRVVRDNRPRWIIHCGAMTAVGDCHQDPASAERVNVAATRRLVAVARELGAGLVLTSTDMVFDGTAAPYGEDAPTSPLSVYGRTKVMAEREVDGAEDALVVRIPLLYGVPVDGRATTFTRQLAALHAGAPLRLFHDEYRTPLALDDAARALIGLARARLAGLIHVAGPQRYSRLELIEACAGLLGLGTDAVAAVSRREVAAAEPRPEDLSLDGARFAREFPELAPEPLRRASLEAGA